MTGMLDRSVPNRTETRKQLHKTSMEIAGRSDRTAGNACLPSRLWIF